MKLFSSRAMNAAVVLTIGQMAGQGLSFARNMLLARYLTKADYGLASAFAFSVALLELAGRMALGLQVVQARDGGEPAFQRNAHAFQLGAGVLSAILLGLTSSLLARMLNVPSQAWAFGLLALIPLGMGLEHLDVYRFQRELKFRPGVVCELVPQVILTLAVWPLVVWLGDFRVILWLMIGKAVLSVVMTHWLAERSYELSWDRGTADRILSFSWPMAINGILLFASQQADQVLVGAWFSLEQLAQYSVPVSILAVPWILFGRVVGPVLTSVLSGVQERRAEFVAKCRLSLEVSATATVLLTVPLIVSGEQIVATLFGNKYSGVGRIMVVLVMASSFRFLRTAPTAIAMALGDTKNLMWANVARSLSLPLALAAVCSGLTIVWVAGCGVVGEVVALAVSFGVMAARHDFPMRQFLKPVVFTVVCLLVSAVIFLCGASHWPLAAAAGVAGVLALGSIGIACCLFPDLLEQLHDRWRDLLLVLRSSHRSSLSSLEASDNVPGTPP